MKPDEIKSLLEKALEHDLNKVFSEGVTKGFSVAINMVKKIRDDIKIPESQREVLSGLVDGMNEALIEYVSMPHSTKPKPEVLQPTIPQPKPNLPKEGFGSVYDQQDRIDLEERDK